jgi:hypothetical protein
MLGYAKSRHIWQRNNYRVFGAETLIVSFDPHNFYADI